MWTESPASPPPDPPPEPPRDCSRCPGLARHRAANRLKQPAWFNAPVPSWGRPDAALLVVGLAPGLRGANRTGRVFTGDESGRLLFRTLERFGFASGTYTGLDDDGMSLRDCRVSNAVRCWPPANRPAPAEVAACNPFLRAELESMTRLRVVLAIGGLAHGAVLRAIGLRPGAAPFRHGAFHELPAGRILADSYHVSRLKVNTGRLTEATFAQVVAAVAARIGPLRAPTLSPS